MVVSEGSPTAELNEQDVRRLVALALQAVPLDGKRVLVIIPDHTRSGPTGMFFRVICDTLMRRVEGLNFLVALGTHPPLSDQQLVNLLGIANDERLRRYGSVGVYNHQWDSPAALQQVGTLKAAQVEELSGGLLSLEVPVLVNKMVCEHDHVIICGPIFPHEVVGFSGGHKYLFPGVAAPEMINFTHWMGALVTNPLINGTRETPVRAAIEAAADMVPGDRSLIGYVVEGPVLRGLFAGPVREAWRAATVLSDQIHVLYRERPFHTVLSCAPAMYDDIWTAGKCMYKLEPIVADGGKLIIYAPHVDEVSYSHGRVLDEIGYHVRDFFVKQWDRYRDHPWGVLAHSTHVKGVGRYDDGDESPRVEVILATRIPKERCDRINLGYMDPDGIDPNDYAQREDEGVLLVPKAGETLFRLNDMRKFGGK